MTDQSGRGRGTRHAVVIGGSIAGLLTARVLAEHAERVTVVERDRYPEGDEPRAGVPQGRHPHVLLEGGQRALDELLPGVVGELEALGAPRLGMPEEFVQHQGGTWFRRTPATTHLFTGTRAQLEALVRRRVLADDRIGVLQGAEAVGLLGDARRVRGVRVRERGTDGASRALAADLVVDAAGRGTRAGDWLAAIGAEAPHEETIDTGLAYATRVYRAPADSPLGTDCAAYYAIPDPRQTYAGGVLPIEGDRYLVVFGGLRGAEPPTDEEAFAAYALRMPHPPLHEFIAKAEPLSPVFGFRQSANVRRRYDRPGRRPAGFLATGDALCAFNPVYGQGMAVAALGATALRRALADPRRTPTTRRVQRALFEASRQAWDIASGADRGMPGALGDGVRTRALDRPVGWYLGRVQERYMGDPELGAVFRSVVALNAPLTALFRPPVLRSVLRPVPPTPGEPPMVRERA
ncbi:FAD-dependent monooxygenase [Streptomyces sp. NPDC001941]|uniref:FAD-dependent oxidoreductase n=1 Tax=Streptomyces sp. NPDC001941 TaxID=3154659 RepID=UPI00332FFD25